MQDFTSFTPNARRDVSSRALTSEAAFFQKVYTWMFAGLLATGVLAYLLLNSESWWAFLIAHQSIFWVAVIAELAVVFILSAKINSFSASGARMMFMLYALLNGLTFSIVLAAYAPAAIFKAFVSTAGVYGGMALFGLVTKRSLQGWGSFLFMGLFGIIIASVVNMFMASNTLDLAICIIGVFIFAGLTAYDHQKLRVIHAGGFAGDELAESRVVIMGALTLYLDFINLFLFLLRLFGSSRD